MSDRRVRIELARVGSGDEGITIVLVAVLAAVLLLVAALAIDGGTAYANRRQMQNAADAAAMSGTRVVEQLRFGSSPPPAGEVWKAIEKSRDDNGADSMSCWFIDAAGSELTGDVCTSEADLSLAWPGVQTSALGVKVEQTGVKQTFFARISGQDSTTARASAAATVQRYLGGTGSPFVVCGVPSVNSDAYPIMDVEGNLLPGAVGQTFVIQGSQIPGCGAGNALKGKNNSDQIVVGVPCVGPGPPYGDPCDHAWGDNGNGFDKEILNVVVGAAPCPTGGPYTNCDILVPVADQGTGNGQFVDMHIVGWVVMHITGDGLGNPKYRGTVLAATTISGGQGGTEPTESSPRVIKLLQ